MVTDSESSISSSKRKTDLSPSETAKKSRKEGTEEAETSKRRDDRNKRSRRREKRSHSRSHDDDRRSRRRRYRDLDDPNTEYHRYYGENDEDENERKNSDRYWTKYPKKDDNFVGRRYYDDEKPQEQKDESKEEKQEDKAVIPPRQRKTVDLLTSKTGGAYIPPAKLRMMQAEITDKTSAAYQRIAWEALKKSIHGYINKINTSNIGIIARELLHENIVRGRGLLCKSIIQAQAASPTFTNVYAALVAVINSKFPNIGELLLKRLVLQFKRGFKQNNKAVCISAAAFVAHLVNQRVAHEILALQILTLLVESPTDDSVEVAISFLKECGQKLTEVSSKGINAIFEMLRNILHEGQLEKRIQYMIEVMFQVRKDGFKDHAAIIEELDVVEEEDQITHLITLDDVKQTNSEDILNVFKFDENYEENEGKYKTLSKEILGSDDSDSEAGSGGSEGSEEEDDEEDEEKEVKDAGTIIDNTETNLITLRRTIYLTIQSSLDFEECAHKLMKMELKPGQEIELCHMFLDCCAEQRTYEKFYGLLAQRFCQINKIYVEPFQQIFKDTYSTTHRLDANRLRNVSKFFAHLLFTDAIGWEVLEIMKLNEEDTNSSSRIFIKILFQELAEYMGLGKLNARLKDPTFQAPFSGLFPRDNPKNTRFAINFFTSIGLGGLTDELREHLKAAPKTIDIPTIQSSSSSSDSSSDDDSSSSSSSSSSSEEENKTKKNKNLEKRKAAEKQKSRREEKQIVPPPEQKSKTQRQREDDDHRRRPRSEKEPDSHRERQDRYNKPRSHRENDSERRKERRNSPPNERREPPNERREPAKERREPPNERREPPKERREERRRNRSRDRNRR